MTVIRNCELPDRLLYDVDHDLWARVEGEEVVIGLTDVGQTRAGNIQHVSFSRRARAGPVGPGDSLAVLESAKWVGPVTSPFAGTASATNDALLDHPGLVNLEPYGRGWIVRLRPSTAIDATVPPEGWSTGRTAAERYEAKLRLPFRSVSGVDEDFWCVHCTDWDV